jgi:hypothetical protein
MVMLLAPQAPNIMAMIQRFNVVSRWVATEIVQVEDLTARASVLNHFLEIMNVRVVCVVLPQSPGYMSHHVTTRSLDRAAMHGAQQLQLLHGDHLWPSVVLSLSAQTDMGGTLVPLCTHARTHALGHTHTHTHGTLVAYPICCGATAHR